MCNNKFRKSRVLLNKLVAMITPDIATLFDMFDMGEKHDGPPKCF